MTELSLFTGAGGGVLGSKILGHKIVGYVEYEKYAQEILKQRIADGILDAAPIFGDIRAFIREGYAERYRGMVDLVTGGFPCQPFSVAGKGLGEDDQRNMWPSTIECIRIIRPRLAFLENVPGILTHKYMGRIFGDLAESGYRVRWTCLGADDVGANHRRKRLWIFAYSTELGLRHKENVEIVEGEGGSELLPIKSGITKDVADPKSTKCEQPGNPRTRRHGLTNSGDLWNPDSRNWDKGKKQKMAGGEETESERNRGGSWWSTLSGMGGASNDVAERVDAFRRLMQGGIR